MRPEAVITFGILRYPISHQLVPVRQGQGHALSYMGQKGCTSGISSHCSRIKKELSIHSPMVGFCQTKNPAELRQILSTLQKESGCDERRECVRQMGELRLKFRPEAIKTGKSALQLDTGLLCIQNFSLALSILTCA